MKILTAVKGTILSVILASTLTASVNAAPNTSSYTMSRSGNTIAVNVSNSEAIDSVEARFAYSGNVDAFDINVVTGSTFTLCAAQSATNIACSVSGNTSVSPGAYRVATITFNPRAGVTNATISVSITAGSSVLAFADGLETLNKGNLPGTSYSYTAPAPSNPTPGNPTPSNPGTSTPNNGGSNTPRTPAANNTSANTPADTSATGGEMAGAQTSNEKAPKADAKTPNNTAAAVTEASSNKTWMWALLLIPVAAAAYALARKFRPEPAVAASAAKTPAKKPAAKKRTVTVAKKTPAKAAR